MKRMLVLFVGLLLAASPAFAQAKAKEKAAKAPAAKTMSASGEVTAVSADSLTVKGKTGEWTFNVDKDTKVTASGASHKTDAMKKENKPTAITDFVKVGDQVNVKFHDMGTSKHAASVSVRTSKPAATKKKK